MVLQLGGTIAKTYKEATHLVMKESVRTTKFLCCVSTVKHIVTADWLKDSSTQHMFLGIKWNFNKYWHITYIEFVFC